MKKIFRHHQTLPALYYRKIGEIAHQWNMIEVYLQTIVWHYLDLDYKQGRLLTYWPGARSKILIFQALTLRWVNEANVKVEIRSIAKKAETLNDDRNKLIHGIWGFEHDARDFYLLHISNIKQKVLPGVTRKSYDDLQSTANEIIALKKRLIALHKILGVAIP